MQRYNPAKIEPKWQKKWQEEKVYSTPLQPKPQKKRYVLDMFPYPSGSGLHVGHVEGYTGTDVLSRYYRMQGFDVLHPMGWDAFGLPAENYAIKVGTHPRETTQTNINNFRRQIRAAGLSYDWEREIDTSDPEYYRWTQWLFLQFFKHGLAYQNKAKVNWCPSCQTVLANEQVIVREQEYVCERCGTAVVQKELKQWFFKITKYQERLLRGLEQLDWPESTKQGQRNWIGKSEGVEIEFTLLGSNKKLTVFTTRPDTIGGATFIVIAPEHPLLLEVDFPQDYRARLEEYLHRTVHKSERERRVVKEKEGVFTGLYALNPYTQTKIPVWVSDFVFMDYGTGVVMGVPAHDPRDFEFALRFNLPIREVVRPERGNYVGYVRREWSKDFDRFVSSLAEIGAEFVDKNSRLVFYQIPRSQVDRWVDLAKTMLEPRSWHEILADRLIVVFGDGKVYEVEKYQEDARVLEKMKAYEKGVRRYKSLWEMLFDSRYRDYVCYTGEGINVDDGFLHGLKVAAAKQRLALWVEKQRIGGRKLSYRLRDWLISRQRYWGAPIPIIYCAQCGKGKDDPALVPVPEEDLPVLLPKDVDFKPTGQSPLIGSRSFHHVTCPRCGAEGDSVWRESDTMDTFVDSSWYFLRFCDPHNKDEFASREQLKKWMPVDLYVGGAEHTVLHLLYARFFTKVLHDLGYLSFSEPFLRLRHPGTVLGTDGRDMSKRYGNVVNPDDVIKEFGADTLRMYELFMGPFNLTKAWDIGGVRGVARFLQRVWNFSNAGLRSESGKWDLALLRKVHQTTKKVTEDIEALKFNTAIAAMMELLNKIEAEASVFDHEAWKQFLLILAPFAPHITEEIWQKYFAVAGDGFVSVHHQQWPRYSPQLIQDEEVTLVVQIDGKTRATINLKPNQAAQKVKVEQLARKNKAIQHHLDGKQVQKVIFVPGRIINFVTG